MSTNNQNGMTLIELMIVVAIIGILAAIAYPSYRDQVRKSNRTEARVELERRAQAMEKCYTRYMKYDSPDCDTIAAERPTERGLYLVGPVSRNATFFELKAVPQGDQASDAKCMTLSITSTGERKTSVNGTPVTDCW